jgi:hypothetical protein
MPIQESLECETAFTHICVGDHRRLCENCIPVEVHHGGEEVCEEISIGKGEKEGRAREKDSGAKGDAIDEDNEGEESVIAEEGRDKGRRTKVRVAPARARRAALLAGEDRA